MAATTLLERLVLGAVSVPALLVEMKPEHDAYPILRMWAKMKRIKPVKVLATAPLNIHPHQVLDGHSAAQLRASLARHLKETEDGTTVLVYEASLLFMEPDGQLPFHEIIKEIKGLRGHIVMFAYSSLLSPYILSSIRALFRSTISLSKQGGIRKAETRLLIENGWRKESVAVEYAAGTLKIVRQAPEAAAFDAPLRQEHREQRDAACSPEIVYDPDSGDDFDEEDPDIDLNI